MTDEEIEAVAIAGGGYWCEEGELGGYWKIENAVLHPLVRTLLPAERERVQAEAIATLAV